MRLDESQIERVFAAQIMQQAVEQISVRSRRNRQMQIGKVTSGGMARINHHHPHLRTCLFRRNQALVKHRMRPGIVGTDDDHQIGGLDVLITHRHRIRTECALVRSHCGGHAQPRIGINVGAADESLHQLVGDIVIFGQELP